MFSGMAKFYEFFCRPFTSLYLCYWIAKIRCIFVSYIV